MKLYEVTEIDWNDGDKVTRYHLTCKSRRDNRLKAENIVQVKEVKPDIDAILEELKKTDISAEMQKHMINCLIF